MIVKAALIIFVKLPVAGEVKTRLCPPLTPGSAAELYGCFVEDILSQCVRLSVNRFDIFVFVSPPESVLNYEEMLTPLKKHAMTGPVITCLAQTDGDLGRRLDQAFAAVFSMGYERIVVLGSDQPTLPDERIVEAFVALNRCDVVIGPSEDGGYYLIGLRTICPALFDRIAWSSARVAGMTIDRIMEVGLTLDVLGYWYDVDDEDSLAKMEGDLDQMPSDIAPRTRQWMNRNRSTLQLRRPA